MRSNASRKERTQSNLLVNILMKDALANELMEFVNGKVFIHGMLLAGYI